LIQLSCTVDPVHLFSRYVWMTSTSETARQYSERFCEAVIRRVGRIKGFVLEVASNDGTFLKPFAERGFRVLGVDPAENIAKLSVVSGIPVVNGFFGRALARELVEKHGIPDVVIARNVLPHVSDLHDFLDGIRICMGRNTLLAVEIHDGAVICDELQYDSIYHEHLCYFTLETVETLFSIHGLHLFDMMSSPISGGSMVLFLGTGKYQRSAELMARQYVEKDNGVNLRETWMEFDKRCREHRERLIRMMKREKDLGRIMAGYGASARSSTLLNYCGIGRDLIPAIADRNPLKQNLCTPGTGIPIDIPERVILPEVDTVVVLAWNFLDEIKRYLASDLSFRGRILAPLPGDPVLMAL
jgi:hypothetical protein